MIARSRLALVPGLVVAALLACRSAEPAPRAALAQDPLLDGIKLYNQGRYAEAEAALRGAPGAEATAYLAASLAKQKRYAEAEAPANAAIQALPRHPVAIAALGEALVGQKKHDDAIARLSAVITDMQGSEAKADAAYAFFWRAQAYYAKKQTARAVDDFEVFVALAPHAPEAETVKQLLASLR